MSLQYNNKIINIICATFLIVFQAYIPRIYITEQIILSFDILIIYLTFLTIFHKTYLIIFVAFILGLFQDFIIHIELLGLCSIIKPMTVYFLGKLKKAENLWLRSYKILFIIFIYFFHFLFFYLISVFEFSFILLLISFIHAISTFLIFILIEKIFYNSTLL